MYSSPLSGHNEQRKTSDQALMANCNERQKMRPRKLFFQLLIRTLWCTVIVWMAVMCMVKHWFSIVTTVCKRTGSILDIVRSYLAVLWHSNIPNGRLLRKMEKMCSLYFRHKVRRFMLDCWSLCCVSMLIMETHGQHDGKWWWWESIRDQNNPISRPGITTDFLNRFNFISQGSNFIQFPTQYNLIRFYISLIGDISVYNTIFAGM